MTAEESGMPADGSPEELAAGYLAQRTLATAVTLDDWLDDLPAEKRAACRDFIEQALAVEQTLEAIWDEDSPGEHAPEIPGFRIERKLGAGGLGTVHAAWDETLERRVAIKILRHGTPQTLRERILDEARKVAAVHDPAIVTVHSLVEAGGAPAMVMEHVEGFPLDRASLALTWLQRARLLATIARALAAAHREGIVHRDLKPDNILVTPDLEVRVLDFGLALRPASGESGAGGFAGTPLYASPEQASGGTEITTASDVFSFGSVMFKVLTGRAPFDGPDPRTVLTAVMESDPPFPRTLDGAVPEDLQSICMACLSRQPAQRPSARDVHLDLERFIAGEPGRLRPALYGDILRHRLGAHQQELRDWAGQGIISEEERDRLDIIYRRMLTDEDHWIFDARRLSYLQTGLYAGTWMVVIAAAMLTAHGWNDLPALGRLSLPAGFTLALVAMGRVAMRRTDQLAAAAFHSGAVLATVPAILALLAEAGLLVRTEGAVQLLPPPFGNRQLFTALALALGLSLSAWSWLRFTAFAWTSALLGAATWFAFVVTQGWLDLVIGAQAFQLLPLCLAVLAALRCEALGRVRWAVPFHVLALVALVGCTDGMAQGGWILRRLGISEVTLPGDLATRVAIALGGLLFLLVMIVIERSRSLDLRRGARVLEFVVPMHLVGGLYSYAVDVETWTGVLLYCAAVILLLALGPWRSRTRILGGGLAGIALASHLVVELDLMDAVPFALMLAAAGFLAAVASYLRLRPRRP